MSNIKYEGILHQILILHVLFYKSKQTCLSAFPCIRHSICIFDRICGINPSTFSRVNSITKSHPRINALQTKFKYTMLQSQLPGISENTEILGGIKNKPTVLFTSDQCEPNLLGIFM